jgi:hypothetical protein
MCEILINFKPGTLSLTAGSILLVLCGCSGSSQEAQVSGQVKLDGNPFGPGTIVFAPTAQGAKPATGSIDDRGNYSMNTSRERGLSAGKYKVAVSIHELPKNFKRGERPPPGKSLIPEKYENEATSGFEYDVAPGSNTINIELQSK